MINTTGLFRLLVRDRTAKSSKTNMRNKQLVLLLFFLCMPFVHSFGQQTALKTNMLFWATTSPNGGVEVGLGRKFSLDIWGAYNAWKFKNDMHLNFYLAQPEVRYWFCRKFEGHFIGLHGHYGHFNIGQIPFIEKLENHELRGNLYGGGVTYGYHWALGVHWGLEAMIGGGVALMDYTKYRCGSCAEAVGLYKRTYFGPTRIGLSVIYFLR